jgi:hypothetical protein
LRPHLGLPVLIQAPLLADPIHYSKGEVRQEKESPDKARQPEHSHRMHASGTASHGSRNRTANCHF